MDIREFFSSDNKDNWIAQMKACDWGPGKWLGDLLEQGKLQIDSEEKNIRMEKGEKWKASI